MKVTSKGQVTIPKRVRDYLGIKPGAAVEFAVSGDGKVELRRAGAKKKAETRIDRIRGTATEFKGMTTEEIMTFLRGEPWPPSEP